MGCVLHVSGVDIVGTYRKFPLGRPELSRRCANEKKALYTHFTGRIVLWMDNEE